MSRLTRLLSAITLIALFATSFSAPVALSAHSTPAHTAHLAQADIESLAALMPADSAVFFALRTDDDYIELLDSILQKALDRLPQTPRFSLNQLLDRIVAPLGGNFQTTIRSWLGDNAAFAFGSLDKLLDTNPRNDLETEVLFAVQITDRARFEALFERLALPSGYAKNSTPDFTDYTDVVLPVLLRVTENWLLLGTRAGVQSVQNRAAKLNTNSEFQKIIGALPADGYNILAYFNLSSVFTQSAIELLPPTQRNLIAQGFVRFAIGATILDGRSLVLDFVAPDSSSVLGIDLNKPTDPAFARFMPANTVFSFQIRDLKSFYEAILAALRASLEAQGGTALRDLERGLEQLESTLRILLRLDLNEDILSWMTGNVALFIAYTPQEPSLLEALRDLENQVAFVGLDFGLIVEATDPSKAANLVAELGNALKAALRNQPDVTVTQEERRVTVALKPRDLTTPIEIVISANDAVFYIATGAAAAHIESGEEGLSAAAGYREAAQYLLPESAQIWYMGSDAINLIGELVALQESSTFSFGGREETFKRVRRAWADLASLISSSSISTAIKDGFQVTRAVLSVVE